MKKAPGVGAVRKTLCKIYGLGLTNDLDSPSYLAPFPMKLTLRQYSALDEMLKAFVLQVHGAYLEVDRMAEGRRVSLFSLFNFYVEVWYNEKETAVQYLVPFQDKRKLEPYLKQIDIPDFIKH